VLDEKLQLIGAQVKGNSGLAGVIPSAKISEILTLADQSASFRYPEVSQTPRA